MELKKAFGGDRRSERLRSENGGRPQPRSSYFRTNSNENGWPLRLPVPDPLRICFPLCSSSARRALLVAAALSFVLLERGHRGCPSTPSEPPGLGVVPCRLSVRLALHMLPVLASIPLGGERGSCQGKLGIPRPRYGKTVPLRGSTVVLAIVC